MRFPPLAAAVLLSACTVGPDYSGVRAPSPGLFAEHPATPAEIARTDAEMRAWWASFGDPTLDALVERAIDRNLDLREQTQAVIEARAMRNEARAAFYPQVSATALGGDQQFSATEQYPPSEGISTFNRLYEGGVLLNWQLDLFGGIRRSVQAANATLDATIEQRRGVLVSLLADLVDQYATLRANQARLAIAQGNVRIARDALALTEKTFQQGVGTSLQVAQAQATLDTVGATLGPIRTAIGRSAHAIAVLAGDLPERDTASLEAPGPVPDVPPLPTALPSTVLVERPDIREAERRYAASVAEIGVAVAQLYPQFTVPIYAIPASSSLGAIFESASVSWQIALSATQSLYTGGRIRNRIVAARAAAERNRLAYVQTVLAAFRDVEDGIVSYEQEADRHRSLVAAAAASRLAYQRADILYGHGLTGFLDVLTAENMVFSADDAVAVSTLFQLEDAVALFRAIGAGWQGADFSRADPSGAGLPVSLAAEHAAAAAARAPLPR